MIDTPKKTIEDWIAALKSGQYNQTFGTLCVQGCYCALGVGYKIAEIEIEQADSNYRDIAQYYSIDLKFVNQIWRWNDRDKKTLPEIGALMESWINNRQDYISEV